MPGLSYEKYLTVSQTYGLDPRNPPEPVKCDNAIHLASWFKLFGFAARAMLEHKEL